METYDIAIIGGGVIGCAIARELSRYELKILLLEKEADVGFGTSKANSGIVHSGEHNKPGTLKAALCVEGNRLFEQLCAELDVPFRRIGSLVVALDQEQMDAIDHLLEQGLKNGVPGLQKVGPEWIRENEPAVTDKAPGALYAPSAGITSPFMLTAALAENARTNGVNIRLEAEVVGLQWADSKFDIKLASGESFQSRYVVNSAGLFSDTIANMVGDSTVRIQPRKGEEYVLDTTWGSLVSRVIFPAPSGFWGKGILVIPATDRSLLIGPTADDTEDKSDLRTTRGGFQRVLDFAKQMVPVITESAVVTSYAGIRASSDGGDFVICPSRTNPRLIHSAGIDSPGLTASPAIALRVVRELADQGLELHRKLSYISNRSRLKPFAEMTRDERALSVRENPDYGSVVCRCREVSRAEVLAAIDSGATTVDGVKLRTGCGAGRCQGGFCLPRLLPLMAERLNKPMVEITKRGRGSRLLVSAIKEPLMEGADD